MPPCDDISNWLHLSKENNDPVAQYNLGVLYGEGKGVQQSYVEANCISSNECGQQVDLS